MCLSTNLFMYQRWQNQCQKQNKNRPLQARTHPSQENHYQLQGCLSQRNKPLPLKFAVQNPALYTQRITSGLINQLQLSISGEVKAGTPSTQGRTLCCAPICFIG